MRCIIFQVLLYLVLGTAIAAADPIKYLGNHPTDRQTGWHENAQGLTHDGTYWFVTQEKRIWRVPITRDLSAKAKRTQQNNEVRSTTLAKWRKSFGCTHKNDDDDLHWHYGDPVISGEFLFVPLEWCKPGWQDLIVVLDKNLKFLAVARAKGMKHLPWLAVEPGTQILYTSNFGSLPKKSDYTTKVRDKNGKLQAKLRKVFYNKAMKASAIKQINRFKYTMVQTQTPSGKKWTLALKELPALDLKTPIHRIQGGVFSPQGVLYLVSDVKNHGIYAFEKRSTGLEQIAFEKVVFKPGIPYGEELEGITWFDVDHHRLRHSPDRPQKIAPRVQGGQLHLVMLDNDLSKDEVYVKHFRVTESVQSKASVQSYYGQKKTRQGISVCIKTHNGHYLRQNPDNWDEVGADGKQCGVHETFEVISLGGLLRNGGKVALRAPIRVGVKNRYLSAQPPRNGAWKLEANRVDIRQWETFTLELPTQEKNGLLGLHHMVRFKSHHGRYLVAENGGSGRLHADRTVPKQWESFDLEAAKTCPEGQLTGQGCQVWRVSEFARLLGPNCEKGKPGCGCTVKPGSRPGYGQLMCIEAKPPAGRHAPQAHGRSANPQDRRSAANRGRRRARGTPNNTARAQNQCSWKAGKLVKTVRLSGREYNLCTLQIGEKPMKDIHSCHVVPRVRRGKAYFAPMKPGCPYWISKSGAGVYRDSELK